MPVALRHLPLKVTVDAAGEGVAKTLVFRRAATPMGAWRGEFPINPSPGG